MSANDRQEGGSHYKTPEGVPQHWDLSILYGWDPFQYQVTKYVMRWKTKHDTPAKRLEDLLKARHFLDKYIEEAQRGTVFPALSNPQRDQRIAEEARREAAEEWAEKVGAANNRAILGYCRGWATALEAIRSGKPSGPLVKLETPEPNAQPVYRCLRCGALVTCTEAEDPYLVHGECMGRPAIDPDAPIAPDF